MDIWNIWITLFPLRGSIKSLSKPELTVEVSYLGYLSITGIVEEEEILICTGLTAQQVFDILPGETLSEGRVIMVRNLNEANVIRCVICPRIRTPFTLTFSRPQLEKLVAEEF